MSNTQSVVYDLFCIYELFYTSATFSLLRRSVTPRAYGARAVAPAARYFRIYRAHGARARDLERRSLTPLIIGKV